LIWFVSILCIQTSIKHDAPHNSLKADHISAIRKTSLVKTIADEITSFSDHPSLIVFDLDNTLWTGFVHTLHGPITAEVNTTEHSFVDTEGVRMEVSADAVRIIKAVKSAGLKVAVASRSPSASLAHQALDASRLSKYVDYTAIFFRDTKDDHLRTIQKESGVPLGHMMLFDDEQQMVDSARAIGVSSIKVDPLKLLTLDVFRKALKTYHSSNR